MPDAIVLETNGSYTMVNLTDTIDYEIQVNGNNLTLIHFDCDTKGIHLSCYVNGNGKQDGLIPNPWTLFIISMGALIEDDEFIYGNIVLLSLNEESGDDKNIDQHTIDLVKEIQMRNLVSSSPSRKRPCMESVRRRLVYHCTL